MTQITLRAQNLAKSYKSRQVVKDVSLTVKPVKLLVYSAQTERAKPRPLHGCRVGKER